MEFVVLRTSFRVKIKHVFISVQRTEIFVEKMAFASIPILMGLLHAGTITKTFKS